jgi:hypothetical protein
VTLAEGGPTQLYGIVATMPRDELMTWRDNLESADDVPITRQRLEGAARQLAARLTALADAVRATELDIPPG